MKTTRRFQKKVEDFVCTHCGEAVVGDGYTNHCPVCLYSRHVDVHPGDRASACGGPMEPVALESRHGEWVITHACQTCGHVRKNKRQAVDRSESVAALAQRLTEK